MYFTRTVIRTAVEHCEVSIKNGTTELVDIKTDFLDGNVTVAKAEKIIRKEHGSNRHLLNVQTVKTTFGIDKDTFFKYATEVKNPPAETKAAE